MDPEVVNQSPLYLNWSFWAVVAAAAALALSQLPPIRVWFKRAKLDLEVYSRIVLTHKLGNPNAQIHAIVSNTGGRPVRIRSIELQFTRDKRNSFTLPIQSYYPSPSDKDAVLFTPTLLQPGDDWSHTSNFLNFFDRTDERRFRDAESNLRQNITEKRVHTPPDRLIEADPEVVAPLMEFFQEKFDWMLGEYEVTVNVLGDKASVSRKYLFTVFESESNELRAVTEGYRYGAGVYWDPERGPIFSVAIQLNEVVDA